MHIVLMNKNCRELVDFEHLSIDDVVGTVEPFEFVVDVDV